MVVELRVHGAGGPTPEDLLDVPGTRRVAGDPSAGFFRPWPEQQREPQLEGYSWGGLTSASRLRSLWVLLIPFALVNLAGWMVRHGGGAAITAPRERTWPESTAVALIRIFGLVVTVATVAYVTGAGVDLVAYQCGAHPACVDGRWWLWPWNNRLVADHLGRILVVGALVPIGAVLGLAWLTRRSQRAIHPVRAETGFTGSSDPTFTVGLEDQALWKSPHVAHRLGLTHTAAALAAVAVALMSVATRVGVTDSSLVSTLGWVVLVAAAVALVRLDGVHSRVHFGLLMVASVHLIASLAVVWAGEGTAGPGSAPGVEIIPDLLLPVYPAMALVTAVMAVALWLPERTGSLRVALVSPALLLAASGIVNAFGSGFLIRLADLLGTPVVASDFPPARSLTQAPIVYPDVLGDTAVVTVVTMVVMVVVVGVVWVRGGEGPGCRILAERYADRGGLDCADPSDREWARRVGRAEATATLTEQAARVVGVVTGVVVTATAVAVLLSGDEAGMRLGPWAERLAGPASVILGLLPLVAIYAISRLYQSRAVRRVVGIAWDVATFWPRWFHPWCPPGYGERAVPQLGDRLAVLTGRVVLSAHSQGSVLAVATVARVDDEVASRTSLLTYGSPLTRLYARYFPEYFSVEMFSRLAERMSGWVNLWRTTDYIGGPIDAAGVVDVEVLDPPLPQMSDGTRPLPSRHSDYEHTEEYRVALADLAGV